MKAEAGGWMSRLVWLGSVERDAYEDDCDDCEEHEDTRLCLCFLCLLV